MGHKKREKTKYPVHSFRANKGTIKELNKLRGRLTWNMFFITIVRMLKGIKCGKCGASGILKKHHIIAKKNGGSNKKDNIEYLCVGCYRGNKKLGEKN